MKRHFLFYTISSLIFFTSCVSQKKYQAAMTSAQALNAKNIELGNTITDLRNQITTLQNDNAKLVKQINDAMKKASEATGVANMTQKQLDDEQKRLWDLRKLLQQQRDAVEGLRKKMADALVGFNSNELQVFVKNGRVYVSLQENLLFPSGSAVVNPKGKQALGTLAQVLNVNPDINIVVEGHTDSIPIHGKFQDNWDLSTARANAIARILIDGYQVDPTRITASGKSKYDPVDSNDTAEGRQRNRRTEIILAPKLDQLMQLLQENPVADSGTR
jgi:chemotaxis protein MotB